MSDGSTGVTVKFGGSALVPAPKVSIGKEYTEGEDGGVLCSTFNITLNGVISAPVSDETGNLGTILSTQKSIRSAFAQSLSTADATGAGETLDVNGQVYNGCHVKSLDFDGGGPTEVSLVQLGFYTIVLSCTAGDGVFDYNITSASENWEVEYAEDIKHAVMSATALSAVKIAYRVSHTVSATGKPKYKSDNDLADDGLAWQQARLYVLNRLELQDVNDSDMTTGGADTAGTLDVPSGLKSRNHVRSQSADEKGGTFSVTETFILYDISDDVTQDVEANLSQTPAEHGRTTVSINGTITGLRSLLINVDDAYDKAISHFITLFSDDNDTQNERLKDQAKNLSGASVTLNAIPLSRVISKNPAAGTVTYSAEFDDRPEVTMTDAISESATVNDTHAGYQFGATPAIGRGIKGPVLQWLGAGSESKRTLTLEVVWPPEASYCNPVTSLPSLHVTYGGEIQTVIANAAPAGNPVHGPPRESWDPANGRYTLEIEWTYTYSDLDMFTPQIP
jgi:hypothetical protein